jgi:AraC-like DNA-binding protein
MNRVELQNMGNSGAYTLTQNGYTRRWQCFHETTTITWVLRGAASYRCGSITGMLQPNTVLICPARELHVTAAVGTPIDSFSIFLGHQLQSKLRVEAAYEAAMGGPLLSALEAARVASVSGAAAERVCAVKDVLVELTAHAGTRPSASPQSPFLRAARVLEEMYRAEPNKPVDIREAATNMSLSYYWFVRSFGRAFGTPPYQYVKCVRLARARELLAAGPTRDIRSLADVAAVAGYADCSHMSREFKKAHNTTPSDLARTSKRWPLRPYSAVNPLPLAAE